MVEAASDAEDVTRDQTHHSQVATASELSLNLLCRHTLKLQLTPVSYKYTFTLLYNFDNFETTLMFIFAKKPVVVVVASLHHRIERQNLIRM